jgi:[lysine-biosynthesis-protein LysW]--L-2-aminoadipate ligase
VTDERPLAASSRAGSDNLRAVPKRAGVQAAPDGRAMPPAELTGRNDRPRFSLVAGLATETNLRLLQAFAELDFDVARVSPGARPPRLRAGDLVLGRLDVLPTLDGVEDGLWSLRRLERELVRLLNRPSALLATHDKLATALALSRAGLPHPRTSLVDHGRGACRLRAPVVVKPRFGSWGRDVMLCASTDGLRACLAGLSARSWCGRQGVLVQELIPPAGYDLRVVVAAGAAIGAIRRVAARGEWRTNVALGGTRRATTPPRAAVALAIAAATAVGADLVGVDLLPRPGGGWVVLELNGAVDFTDHYSPPGGDVFALAARHLCEAASAAAANEVRHPGAAAGAAVVRSDQVAARTITRGGDA